MLPSASGLIGVLLAQFLAGSDPSVGKAKMHFELGQVHFRAGDYSGAVREFEAANTLRPHPIFLYDMAQAYRLSGDTLRALEMYRAYLAVEPGAKNRKSIQRRIDALRVALNQPQPPQPQRTPYEVGAPPDAEPESLVGLLAVLDLHSRLEGDAKLAVDVGYLADLLRGAALRAGPGIEVITRESLAVLLKDEGKASPGCERDCDVATGRKVGADLVMTGDLVRLGANYKLDLKLRDTRSGKLLSTAVANAATVDELSAQAQEAARDLMHLRLQR